MANDLRNQKISSTFQRLIQIDPDDNVTMRDGTGSLIQQLGIQKYITIGETTNFSLSPSTGYGILFISSSNKIFYKDDSDVEYDLTLGDTGSQQSVASDATPQLGGNLDLNSYNISGSGNIDTVGSITGSQGIYITDGSSLFMGSGTERIYIDNSGVGDKLVLSGSDDINMHAGDDINMYAKSNIRIDTSGSGDISITSADNIDITATDDIDIITGANGGDALTFKSGGDMIISSSISGTAGKYLYLDLTNIPTTNPGVVGAIWVSESIVRVST